VASDSAQRRETHELSGVKKLVFLGITAFLFVALLCGIEAAVRLVLWKRYGATGPTTTSLRDRYVAWRNNPAFRRVDIRHNSQGFRRSTETPRRKPPGTVRIFLLGGSTAYGSATGFANIDRAHVRLYNDQTIDAWLERELNASFPERRWEVINAAAPGYRLHQQLALIESVILGYQPDQFILLDGYNDVIQLYDAARWDRLEGFDEYANTMGQREFDLLANPKSFGSLFVFASSWLRANSSLVRLMEDRGVSLLRSPWDQTQPYVGRKYAEPVQVSDLDPKARQQAAAALTQAASYVHTARQIHRISSLDGIMPVFLLQPILVLSHKPFTEKEKQMREYDAASGGPLYLYLFREAYHKVADDMAAAAERDGFHFVNMENLYDTWSGQAFTDFAHLTPEGNRLVAEEVFAHFGRTFAEEAGIRTGQLNPSR
jgi:hypothetical protein